MKRDNNKEYSLRRSAEEKSAARKSSGNVSLSNKAAAKKGLDEEPQERGLSKITAVILLSILAAGIYTASKILPFYYYYFEMTNQFEQIIKIASTENDEYIRRRINEMIDWYQLPADKAKLTITRQGNRMTIKLPYREVFYLTYRGKDYDIKAFDFEIYANGQF